MKMLLRDFNAKVGREDVFKLKIGNQGQHKISNENRFSAANFSTSNREL
jgi:hypothetical protein